MRHQDVLQPRVQIALYSPIEQVVDMQKERQGAGERDRVIQAVGWGDLVPNLQHPPPSNPVAESRRAGSAAKPCLGCTSRGVGTVFVGTRGTLTASAHPCKGWGCTHTSFVSVASIKYCFLLNLNIF